MTDKKRIERIEGLLANLNLDDMSWYDFVNKFEKMSLADLKDEMWKIICFVEDVADTLNM